MYKYLNRFYRRIATGICFFLFSFFGAILGYIYFPLVRIFIKDKSARTIHAQHTINIGFKIFIGIIHHFRIIRFEFEGIEKLYQDKGCIFIANHPTLIDYVAIVSRLKLCDNIVKQSLWENPYYKHVIETAGYIPNINPDQTFSRLNEIFAEGRNLLMFPEGTRTSPNQLPKLKRGAAQLAIRTNAPIRMIHISCSPVTLTKNTKWYNIAETTPLFRVVVGDKINPQDFIDEADGIPSLAARRLTKFLQYNLSTKLDFL
ncbi:lysophospholipid acyltransferase family protein [Francisella marina]|uniref:1-acyl-sn-glycerol-3-phosphate acyltransferase n=1 Tax=Francisella marina TaxID=2249302 RepID=A0ABX5ZHZ3_9GAMM|nr:lysophospholipid acyltransferase family protein [Francisella marina]QEO57614.1 1-acyl-sn-glycerol-3-phosphate acyltransferase [Francisella marina]QEO58272.1 1-acyl-sn-glycerol-3-phosphate acyltransferase [Francisella marina]